MTLDKWGRTLCKACGLHYHDPKYLMCLDCGMTYRTKKQIEDCDKRKEAELKTDKDMEMYMDTREQSLEFENRRGE